MPNNSQNSHGRSAYDLLKDFGLPAISVAGMLLSLDSAIRFIAFSVVTLLFGVLGLWPRAVRGIRNRRTDRSDEQFARSAFEQLRQFVRRFGDFVNKGTTDTLHYVVGRELSEPVRAAFASQYQATPIELWSDFWYFLDQRVRQPRPRFEDLAPTIQEFNSLIRHYHSSCVAPVFSGMSADLRAHLDDIDRSKLNRFHRRYDAFVDEYLQFQRLLAESHPALEHLPRYLPTADPL